MREIREIRGSRRITSRRLESIECCESYGSEDGNDRDRDDELNEGETMAGFETGLGTILFHITSSFDESI